MLILSIQVPVCSDISKEFAKIPRPVTSSGRNNMRRTTVKLTPGKLAGMKAVSDKRGVIAAAAMDQRGSLQKALAKEKRL